MIYAFHRNYGIGNAPALYISHHSLNSTMHLCMTQIEDTWKQGQIHYKSGVKCMWGFSHCNTLGPSLIVSADSLTSTIENGGG